MYRAVPILNSTSTKLPLLLIAGKQDKLIGFEQSNRLRYVLEKLNKDLEFINYKRAGLGQKYWLENRHENALIVEFLHDKLNLPHLNNEALSKADKKALIFDYLILGEVFANENVTEPQPDKAFKYRNIASNLGDPQSMFNQATHYQQKTSSHQKFRM